VRGPYTYYFIQIVSPYNNYKTEVSKIDYLVQSTVSNPKGVDKNAVNNDGNTPLLLAVERDRVDAVRILLEYDADRTVKNAMGDTPLDIAKRNKMSLIIELFKHKGIS
jgi:ankyrin repeat protein